LIYLFIKLICLNSYCNTRLNWLSVDWLNELNEWTECWLTEWTE
jgi:hypothetical protein